MAEIGQDIKHAIHLLMEGKLVAIPTETVYGLAGNGLRSEVVTEIFQVKNRPAFDPMILHTDSLDKMKGLITSIPSALKSLTDAFWPGPLTILLEKTDRIPDLVTSGLPKVAVRIPGHPMTNKLLSLIPFPLAAPSANPFGYISPTNAKHVEEQLGHLIPYILDGGQCTVGVESTIVDYHECEVIILRQGGITSEAIEGVLGQEVRMQTSSSRPMAPGMLDIHYAPRIPLVIDNLDLVKQQFPTEKIGYLAFTKAHPDIPLNNQRILSKHGSLAEAAQNFFGFLRQFDKLHLSVVLAEMLPDEGLGKAINDKLRRAARRLEKFGK